MARCMKCGGSKKMAKGGPINKPMTYAKAQKGGDAQKNFIYGMPTAGIGETDGKNGKMKKGGSTSLYNRSVTPGCRGGMVKDANGNCVDERKAKKGMNFKDLSGDDKITRKDVLIGRGVIPKKAAGGPILDKLKAKLAERKITKTIKQGIKAQVKQKKKLG